MTLGTVSAITLLIYGVVTLPLTDMEKSNGFIYTIVGGSIMVVILFICLRWYYLDGVTRKQVAPIPYRKSILKAHNPLVVRRVNLPYAETNVQTEHSIQTETNAQTEHSIQTETNVQTETTIQTEITIQTEPNLQTEQKAPQIENTMLNEWKIHPFLIPPSTGKHTSYDWYAYRKPVEII